jgi:hypothetical protein
VHASKLNTVYVNVDVVRALVLDLAVTIRRVMVLTIRPWRVPIGQNCFHIRNPVG